MNAAARFLLAAGAAVLAPAGASAHCDTLDGPVVADARAALDAKDAAPVLRWVPADSERETREALRRALDVRGAGGEARALADTWFFETVVRLHRTGEGAPFDGLKPAGTPVPEVIRAADRVVAGDLDARELEDHLARSVTGGVEERFARLEHLRERRDDSVEAGREWVAAYVDAVHYVERVAEVAAGAGHHDPAVHGAE